MSYGGMPERKGAQCQDDAMPRLFGVAILMDADVKIRINAARAQAISRHWG